MGDANQHNFDLLNKIIYNYYSIVVNRGRDFHMWFSHIYPQPAIEVSYMLNHRAVINVYCFCYGKLELGVDAMGEEITNTPEGTTSNYPKKKTQTSKPRAVYLWTVADVLKWYKRHCGDYLKYYEFFQRHEITGRTLLRITDNSLERMGITDNKDREAIWREILKQKLKTDIMEIRDLELMNECPF